MRQQITSAILISVLSIILINCNGGSGSYNPANYYTPDKRDTLLVNIVTYIGKKPRLADHHNRHNQEHRKFYTQQSQDYMLAYYFITDDSTHYYYLIRPARSSRGNTRGVGGKFRMKEPLELHDFEELFNTPVLDEQELMEIGETLFTEMVNSGNINQYSGNKEYIEWPDERLKYNREKNEWRYDVN